MQNQIGSTPMASTTGMKTGIATSMIEIVSMKQPSSNTMSFMMMTVTSGDRSSSATAATRADVAPVAASNWLKPDEPTMTSSIIEVVVMAAISDDPSAAQLNRR